jgi:hypothetical protein
MQHFVGFWLKYNFAHILIYISQHSAWNQKHPENIYTSLPQQNGTRKQRIYKNAQYIFQILNYFNKNPVWFLKNKLSGLHTSRTAIYQKTD